MPYKFNLLDYVVYFRENHNDFDTVMPLGQVTGRFFEDGSETKPRYFVNGDTRSFAQDELKFAPISFDVWVELNTQSGEFETFTIDHSNQYLKPMAEFVQTISIKSVEPEITLYVYWNVAPGSIPKTSVKEYLKSLYITSARHSERSN